MGLCYSLRTCVCLSFPMLWAFICLWGVRPQSVRLRWALETEFSFLAHTVVSIPGRESRICSVSTLCDSFEESADVDDNNANGPFKRMRRRKLERERERERGRGEQRCCLLRRNLGSGELCVLQVGYIRQQAWNRRRRPVLESGTRSSSHSKVDTYSSENEFIQDLFHSAIRRLLPSHSELVYYKS